MRNNSLRQQAWQNKQQANIFKKVTQLTPNLAFDENQPPSTQSNSFKTNHNEHSEIKWLQKIMTDMNNFKQVQKADSVLRQKLIDTNSQELREKQIQYQAFHTAQKKNLSKESKKGDFKQEGSKKSGFKIKFQVIPNKENRFSSQKRGLTSTPCKNTDKVKNKSNKKFVQSAISRQRQKAKDKQLENNNKRQKGNSDIQIMVTQSFAIQESFQSKNNQCLWKTDVNNLNNQNKHLANSKEKPKIIVGKIVKNNLNQTIIQQIASKIFKKSPQIQENKQSLQKQQQSHMKIKESDRKKRQKVFIKLETQKLSKYLIQSEVKEAIYSVQPQKQLHFENEQFTKYCPTKRGDHIVIRAVNTSLNTESDILSIDKTAKIERKKNVERNMKINHSFNDQRILAKTNSKYLSFKKQKQQINGSFEGQVISQSKAKSQQRKLNRIQRVPHNQAFLWQNKPQQAQQIPSFSFKKTEQSRKNSQTSQAQENQFLIVKYPKVQQKSQRKLLKNQKPQKIFTLNSDREQKVVNSQLNIIQAEQKQIPIQTNTAFEEQVDQMFDFIGNRSFYYQKYNEDAKTIPKSAQKHQGNQNLQQSTTQIVDSDNQHYPQMLKQLFYFLDQEKRCILSSLNCKSEYLTEELKLLISPIINQIKSKKQTYNLEKFIAQGQQILKVKQEVYKTSRVHFKKSKISQILKENIQVLIKKAPFDFLHQTHTYSYYESSQNSKRESTKDNHSIVISKLMTHQKLKTNRVVEPSKKSVVQKRKLQQQQIDLQQPEFYLQKKYGIGTSRFEYQGRLSSNYPQFTIGDSKDQQRFWKK